MKITVTIEVDPVTYGPARGAATCAQVLNTVEHDVEGALHNLGLRVVGRPRVVG